MPTIFLSRIKTQADLKHILELAFESNIDSNIHIEYYKRKITDASMREEDRYAHETRLINEYTFDLLFGIIKTIWIIVSFLIEIIFYILITPLMTLWLYLNINRFIGSMIKILIHLIVIPIVDSLYPVFTIEKKFDQIILMNPDEESELTQDKWNSYVMYLNKSSSSSHDMFDVLISQKIELINFDVTVAINRTNTEPRYLTFAAFYSKLKNIIGDAIDIRYRCAQNILFVGIFGDQGPYRKFRYYDVI